MGKGSPVATHGGHGLFAAVVTAAAAAVAAVSAVVVRLPA